MKLSDLNLLDFGNTITLAGAIYVGKGHTLLAFFPEDLPEIGEQGWSIHGAMDILRLTSDDWKALIRQTDILETEMLARAKDQTLTKVIVRKSTRQIEQGLMWKVFKRDDYMCRYCGKDDVPLTVDHAILWEDGGPTIEENLVSACRKCNKMRGNMQYFDWLHSRYYAQVSQNLDRESYQANQALLDVLDKIPVRITERSR